MRFQGKSSWRKETYNAVGGRCVVVVDLYNSAQQLRIISSALGGWNDVMMLLL